MPAVNARWTYRSCQRCWRQLRWCGGACRVLKIIHRTQQQQSTTYFTCFLFSTLPVSPALSLSLPLSGSRPHPISLSFHFIPSPGFKSRFCGGISVLQRKMWGTNYYVLCRRNIQHTKADHCALVLSHTFCGLKYFSSKQWTTAAAIVWYETLFCP